MNKYFRSIAVKLLGESVMLFFCPFKHSFFVDQANPEQAVLLSSSLILEKRPLWSRARISAGLRQQPLAPNYTREEAAGCVTEELMGSAEGFGYRLHVNYWR